MSKESKIWTGAVLAAFALGVILTLVLANGPKSADPLVIVGAVGTKTPVERYIPVIQQNGGYYSTLPIWVTASSTFEGAHTIGVLNVSGDLTVDSTDFFLDVSADKAGFGTSSPAHDFVVSGSATSTFSGDTDSATTSAFIYSREALFGGQIILENPDGTTCSNIVLNDAGTALVVATITCPVE